MISDNLPPLQSAPSPQRKPGLWQRLIGRSVLIQSPDLQGQSSLLTALLLIEVPALLLSVIASYLNNGRFGAAFVQAGIAALLIVAYVLNRIGRLSWGAAIVVGVNAAVPIASLIVSGDFSAANVSNVLKWVVLGYVLSGALLPLIGVAVVVAGNAVSVILLMATQGLRFSDLGGSLGFVITMSALTLAIAYYRNRVNFAQQNTLLQRNRELQELNASLGDYSAQLETRSTQLRASVEVARTATSILDPNRLIHDVINLITEQFGFYYAAIFILDEQGAFAVLREATGEAGQALKASRHRLEVGGASMVGYVTAHRKPRIALDVGAEAVRFANPLLPETRSEIALPLLVGERVLGALDVQSTQPAAFDETSIATLQSMADQVAIALDNATSYSAMQMTARRSRVLYEASQQIGRLESDLAGTLSAMVHLVGETLNYTQWRIATFDERREWLTPIVSVAHPDRNTPVRAADQPNSPAVRSATRGETYIINDPHNDPRLADVPLDRRAAIGKFISVPIIVRGESVGVLTFGRSIDAPDLGEPDLEAGLALASLAAIAVENRTLFDRTQNALHEVAAVNRRLTGEAWQGYLAARGDILFASGTADAQQIGSHISAPITVRGETLGALSLEDTEAGRQWSGEDATLLSVVAGEVALAIENARLIEQTQRAVQREKAIAEVSDRIHRPIDLESILRTAIEEISRLTGATEIGIRLGGVDNLDKGNGHAA